MSDFRTEADGMGRIDVPADKLWGAQTQRSLQHFSIGQDLIPREMIAAYVIIKRAAATANHRVGRLPDQVYALKEAALQLGHVDEETFDRVVDPAKMVRPYVANKADHGVRAADTVEIAQMEQTR